MPRLRVPAALHITLFAASSCTQTTNPSDVADVANESVSRMDAASDAITEDVPTACDAVPFVSYCVPTQRDSGVQCGPTRVCYPSECTAAGCTFCSFPVRCLRNDQSYCFTTCNSSDCTGDCPLVA